MVTGTNKDDKPKKEKKKGFFAKIWEKTIFPDMIKARREEKEFRREIMREARQEALKQMKPDLVKAIKQKEIDKLTGKSSVGQKIADGFGDFDVGKKMDRLMGSNNDNSGIPDVSKMLSGEGKTPDVSKMVDTPSKETAEEKIKRLMR